MSLSQNIKIIQTNIKKATAKSGRGFSDVMVIAVTKTIPSDYLVAHLATLIQHDITHFGENRVQELLDKHPHFSSPIQWHMIGHLQRNKVKYLPHKVATIQSVDNWKLAQEINKVGLAHNIIFEVLVEVNIAGESSKHGLLPSELVSFVAQLKAFSQLSVIGLMTVAPYTLTPEDNRGYFRQMYELYTQLQQDPDLDIKHLSMGMTGDYTVAIEEGATMIRIGTGLFGER